MDFGRKGFIWLTSPNHSPSLRDFRVETQKEAEAGTMEVGFLLACFPWLAWFAFFKYNPGPTTQACTTHSDSPPSLIVNGKRHLTDVLQFVSVWLLYCLTWGGLAPRIWVATKERNPHAQFTSQKHKRHGRPEQCAYPPIHSSCRNVLQWILPR